MYTKLVSRCLFPLHEALKGHSTVAKHRQLLTSQWLDHSQLSALQSDRLHAFLSDIAKHNAYYRDLFEQLALSESDFRDQGVLQRIPVLDKDTIRKNHAHFLSDNPTNPIFMSTSGSTGNPLKFAVGNERVSHDVAAKWRATQWWGVDIGDREAVVWGSQIELTGQGLVKAVRDKLFRSRLFPARDLNPQAISDMATDLSDYDPAMIYGYPSILSMVAQHILDHKLPINFPALKVIFCTAEKLYPHQRDVIESAFKATVADGYGSRDAGFIAHQCPHGSLHVCAEDIIVEVLNDNDEACEPGEIGRLIVTNMTTRDFPMVRYDTGDLAKWAKEQSCQCGRTLPVLEEVIGRSNDALTTPSGNVLHGAYVGNVVREEQAIKQFQLIQESSVGFSLSYTAYEGQDADEGALSTRLKKLLGEDAELTILKVPEIKSESTGKYKYVINKTQRR